MDEFTLKRLHKDLCMLEQDDLESFEKFKIICKNYMDVN